MAFQKINYSFNCFRKTVLMVQRPLARVFDFQLKSTNRTRGSPARRRGNGALTTAGDLNADVPNSGRD